MASWTQTFSVNNKYSLTLECSESSYSVANNNSVVSYKLTMATAANSFTGYSDYRTTISISINGSSVYSYDASRDFNPTAKSSYSEVLKSGTVTVAHNSDGTKTCACAASVTVASGTYSPGSASISQNLTLTTIPRASSVSASGQYIGSPVSISISRASSSFTHDLTYSFAGHTGTIATGVATSYSWTPSLSTFGPYIPSSTSGTCTITCTTKNGSTTVGTSTTSFTLYLADSVKPTVSSGWETASYVNSGGASSFAAYVQGYSKLRITFNASKITHGAGASLSKYRLTVGGKNYDSTSTTVTSDTLTSSGSVSYTVYVYDTRGRYASYTGSITVNAYAAPTISSSSIFRSNSSGVADSSGAYISVKATASVSSVNGLNSGTLRTRYRPSGGSWSGWTTLTSGTASVIGGALSPTTTYIVAVELTDTMGNTATTQATIPTESVTFNALEGGNGFAFGKYAETEKVLELASDWMLLPGAGIAGADISGAATSTPTANIIIPVGRLDSSSIGAASASAADVLNALMKYICAAYPGFSRCRFFGTGLGDVSFYFDYLVYDTSQTDSNGYPQYSFGECIFYGGSTSYGAIKYRFGTVAYTPYVLQDTLKTVVKTGTISFSVGTIGTRGFQTSWNSSSIGGTPRFAQITHVANSANYLPVAFLEGTTVYLNAYRCTTSAVSNSTVDVTIYYL